MPDIAVIAPDLAYHSSVGACLDAFALVAGQVERLFARTEAVPMETRVQLLSADGGPVSMADGRRLAVDGGLPASPDLALLHLAAFRVGGREALDVRLEAAAPLLAWLRARAASGTIVSASGSAIFLLAAAGLVRDLPVPMPRALIPLSRTVFPRLPVDDRRPVIEHGAIVMGSGLAADQALMVRLIERVISPELARWFDTVIGTDRIEHEALAEDQLVANAQIWLEQHFAEEVSIAALSETLSTSHQTLIRRFRRALGMRPREYVQYLRIEAAKRMLAATSRPIDQIALLVGYQDTRAFRAAFRERSGSSPRAYRTATRGSPPS